MKMKLHNLPGSKSISKTQQKFISGGYLSNIQCYTNFDCFAVTGDFADRCVNNRCEIR